VHVNFKDAKRLYTVYSKDKTDFEHYMSENQIKIYIGIK